MEDQKLSVEETGTEPWVFDKATQTENYDDPIEVYLGMNAVAPSNYNQEFSVNAQKLDYRNGIQTGRSSLSMRQINPAIPHQNLQNQAISSSTTNDTVNVSEVHEGCKPDMDYHFPKIIQDCMERVPQEKKLACMQEVLSIIKKHTSV